jgi:hypothetical protein
VTTYGNDVLINVIGAFVYAGLIYLGRKAWSRLSDRSPVWKRHRVISAVGLGVLLPFLIVWKSGTDPSYTWPIFALLTSAVLFRDLWQFWRFGLVGVDEQMQTGIDHKKSLDLCQSSFRFLGIGASKLTTEVDAFEAAIDRCDHPHEATQFLLSRPDAEGLERIAHMAKRDRAEYQNAVQASLRVIAKLKRERKKNIEVRFYDDFPAFRLMFMNDNICLVSYYVLGKGSGGDLPQLHIIRTASAGDKSSLYYAFEYYFNSIWSAAEKWDFERYL